MMLFSLFILLYNSSTTQNKTHQTWIVFSYWRAPILITVRSSTLTRTPCISKQAFMNSTNHYAVFANFELGNLVSYPFCDLFVTSSENRNILAMDDSESTVAVSGLSSSALRLVSKSQTTIQYQHSMLCSERKKPE